MHCLRETGSGDPEAAHQLWYLFEAAGFRNKEDGRVGHWNTDLVPACHAIGLGYSTIGELLDQLNTGDPKFDDDCPDFPRIIETDGHIGVAFMPGKNKIKKTYRDAIDIFADFFNVNKKKVVEDC